MVLSVLPVSNDTNQTFEVSLPIKGSNRNLKFFFYWNGIGEYWQFDLYDLDNEGSLILCGEPVYSVDYPYNNIIDKYEYLGLGGLYVINNSGINTDRPNMQQLGSDFILIWGEINEQSV